MRFIQVGVGGFGKGWMQRLMDDARVQLVGLVDVDPAAMEACQLMGNYGPEMCFASLDDALSHVEADAMLCVTPPAYHRQYVVQAMRAGLDVITEKPMADSLTNCMAILRAARDMGRTCVVSQNYRYRPPTWTLARLIEEGRIGDIGQVKVDFYIGVDFGGGFRHRMAYPVLVDMAIHHVDLIRFITGLNAVSVRGEAWNPTWSNYKGDCSSSLVFEMENGARVVYNASWCAKGQFCDWHGNWQIEGAKGSILYQNGAIAVHDVPHLYACRETTTVAVQGPEQEGQAFVLSDFIDSIERETRPQTDVFDNIHSIAMVFAAVEAVKSGKRVQVLDEQVQQLICEQGAIELSEEST